MGAGPAGLAAALALHEQSTESSPIRVTVLELRPSIQTLGGAVNLTPLAMRYLDALGVGSRLRPLGVKVNYINMFSHRTGSSLGRLWPNVDAIRVLRQNLVEAMVQTARAVPGDRVILRYGAKVTCIEQFGDASGEGAVKIHFTDTATGREETIEGDLIIGCDGIHSFVRSSLVDPDRRKTYSGRATAYGFIPVSKPGDAGIAAADGSPAVSVSTLVTGQLGSLLVTFFEPSLRKLYLATVIARPEKADGPDGKRATGEDKEVVQQDFLRRFRGGKLVGLEEAVKRCEEWMPPQGESTGVAIEDGMLLARVFSRRDTRSVAQMLADYEVLRRPVIKKTYDESMFRWERVGDKSWLGIVVMEWFSMLYIWIMNSWSKDNFGRDVRTLDLPA
ncbi:hypothetical protein NEMBOFW57_004197 [Staphylotrichum longicolle]|uniref:FAD-binding domain-containing protein n=1 Tax=Staphylotrichum longicolle TaxID=669026 RepID=A0AAD4F5Y1_9PEZI|nr:hypothetical protein NEMBOFW57_004197 [Staphylotrichum longicolle]